MKIAIQGHPTRGKEVIQILESLGGKNKEGLNGSKEYWYFINSDGYIRNDYKNVLQYKGFKTYTLEEFEKEFPFKIGDKVISLTTGLIGIIIKLEEGGCYYIKYDNENLACGFGQNLKLYKEMKEKRNITLTLDKAKEWYSKGGELKEIALQAFTEKELNPLPRSWEEFSEKYCIKKDEAYINSEGKIMTFACNTTKRIWDNILPSQKSAEAHLAMMQLEQLRNCWWNGWKPEWNNSEKYVIKWEIDNLRVFPAKYIHAFLVFPTREMTEEFLKCFRDLIEKTGDLI